MQWEGSREKHDRDQASPERSALANWALPHVVHSVEEDSPGEARDGMDVMRKSWIQKREGSRAAERRHETDRLGPYGSTLAQDKGRAVYRVGCIVCVLGGDNDG